MELSDEELAAFLEQARSAIAQARVRMTFLAESIDEGAERFSDHPLEVRIAATSAFVQRAWDIDLGGAVMIATAAMMLAAERNSHGS